MAISKHPCLHAPRPHVPKSQQHCTPRLQSRATTTAPQNTDAEDGPTHVRTGHRVRTPRPPNSLAVRPTKSRCHTPLTLRPSCLGRTPRAVPTHHHSRALNNEAQYASSSVKTSVSEARLRWLTELIFQIGHSMGILECQRRPPGLQMIQPRPLYGKHDREFCNC